MDYVRMALESRVKADTAADRVAIEIRKRLGELGQSQAALARALEESPMWVSQRLNGTVQMGVNDLYRIADQLGLSVAELAARAEPTSDEDRDTGLRKRRLLDGILSPARAVVVTGTTPHPAHPIVSTAVPIPRTRNDVRRTAPTGR